MERDKYRITLKLLTAQRRKLILALLHTNYQLGLYAGPKDFATLELIEANNALVDSANSALNLEKRLVTQHMFDPFSNLLEKRFRR